MVKTLRIWQDGVTFMEKGKFEDALMNFMALEGRTDSSQQLITSGRNLFNIGQTYLALERMDMAAKVNITYVRLCFEILTVKTRILEPRIFEVRLNRFLYFRVVFHDSS